MRQTKGALIRELLDEGADYDEIEQETGAKREYIRQTAYQWRREGGKPANAQRHNRRLAQDVEDQDERYDRIRDTPYGFGRNQRQHTTVPAKKAGEGDVEQLYRRYGKEFHDRFEKDGKRSGNNSLHLIDDIDHDQPDEPETEPFECATCDHKVNYGDKHCPNCGNKLDWTGIDKPAPKTRKRTTHRRKPAKKPEETVIDQLEGDLEF